MKKLSFVSILLITVIGGCSLLGQENKTAFTPHIVDADGNTVAGSITSLEKVVLGGVEQTILIRGKDASKPVLLFLHGGPGDSNIPFVKKFQTPELEENFVVVQWDQRGAGASYSDDLTEDDMAVVNFIEDTKALTNHLRARFDQDKIFMLGHSFGSALGFLTIGQYPELYHAYIGAGEAADWNKRQSTSYAWALEQALLKNDQDAIEALEALQPFDYANPEHIAVKNKWVFSYGGHIHKMDKFDEFKSYMGKGPEYTADDVNSFMKGKSWSANTVGIEAVKSNYSLFRDLPEIDIPVYFFAGRHDHQTPATLAEEYYNSVKAPKKGFIWFEDSGHTMIFEEPEKMTRELITIARDTLQ
jgi:pimeloyl-ACP methyl ester carboxylesterase